MCSLTTECVLLLKAALCDSVLRPPTEIHLLPVNKTGCYGAPARADGCCIPPPPLSYTPSYMIHDMSGENDVFGLREMTTMASARRGTMANGCKKWRGFQRRCLRMHDIHFVACVRSTDCAAALRGGAADASVSSRGGHSNALANRSFRRRRCMKSNPQRLVVNYKGRRTLKLYVVS